MNNNIVSKAILDAMDRFIAQCDASRDDVSLRKCFSDTPPFPLPVCSCDPLSQPYKEFVRNLYEELSGINYSVVNEYKRILHINKRMHFTLLKLILRHCLGIPNQKSFCLSQLWQKKFLLMLLHIIPI